MRSHRIVLGVLGLMLVIGTVSEAKTAATVTCTDGTTSKAGRGACSHHGSVAKANTGTAPAADGKSKPAGATAKCEDGTYSHSTHNGACSHHGGVAQWLDGSGQ